MNYKVIKGEVGGFGNRIFKVGETVSDNNFPTGNAETLEKMGFLEKVSEKEKEESNDENPEMTKAEIVSELKQLGVEFNPSDKKAVLLALLEESNKGE